MPFVLVPLLALRTHRQRACIHKKIAHEIDTQLLHLLYFFIFQIEFVHPRLANTVAQQRVTRILKPDMLLIEKIVVRVELVFHANVANVSAPKSAWRECPFGEGKEGSRLVVVSVDFDGEEFVG